MKTPMDPSRAIQPALSGMKSILFRPFQAGTWIILGFVSFLQLLGGSTPPANFFFSIHDFPRNLVHSFHHFEIAGVFEISMVTVLVIAGLIIFALFQWLSSRAHFVYLDNALTGRALIVEPWQQWRKEANSFFLLRLVIYSAIVLVCLIMGLFLYYQTKTFEYAYDFDLSRFIGLFSLGFIYVFIFVIIILSCFVILILLTDFVVPVQYQQKISAFSALREVIDYIIQYPGAFILYFFLRLLFYIVLQVLLVLSALFTCCLSACLFIIPVIGQALLQPYYLFVRLFPVYFLAQSDAFSEIVKRETSPMEG